MIAIRVMFESRETKERRSHFKNLVMLALLDGDFDENEKQFLRQRGISWGLSAKDVEKVLSDPEKVKFVLPREPRDRVVQLYDLIVMMIADGLVREPEMEFCQRLAISMGFRPSEVPKMLEALFESARRQEQEPAIEIEVYLEQD